MSPACELPIALVPVTNVSPERRIIQKEIVAGEERPRISSPKLSNDNSGNYSMFSFCVYYVNYVVKNI